MKKIPAHIKEVNKITAISDLGDKPAVHVQSTTATALVAGGAGFLGSHLCSALLAQNCHVIVLDSLVSGNKNRIQSLLSNNNLQFYQSDLKNNIDLPVKHIDYIFQLAGSHYYTGNKAAQEELLLVNSEGTKNLLELTKKHNAKYLLASTPEVYTGHISSSNLSNYYGSDNNKQTKLGEAKRFAEGLVEQYFQKENVNSRIVRFFDLYGPGMDLDDASSMAKIFKTYTSGGPIQIPGEGLQNLYPTYIDDLVQGLIKAIFSQSSQGKVYTLINLKSISLLNLVYTLKKKKDLSFEYIASSKHNRPLINEAVVEKSQKDLGWKAKISLEEGLASTLSFFNKNTQSIVERQDQHLSFENQIQSPPVKVLDIKAKQKNESKSFIRKIKGFIVGLKSKGKKFNKKEKYETYDTKKKTASLISKKIKIIILSIIIILLLATFPFLIGGVQLYILKSRLIPVQEKIENYKFSEIRASTPKVIKLINSTQKSWRFFAPYYQVLGLSSSLEQLYDLLNVSKNSVELAYEISLIMSDFEKLSGILLNEQEGDYQEEYNNIRLSIKDLHDKSGVLETELEKISQSEIVVKFGFDEAIYKYQKKIPTLRKNLFLANELNGLLPSLFSFEGKKTYLLLLQNNMELRPTGGFIGSYALITFDKGRLLDWQVFDVYDADGQLRGHVEPPVSLKKHLGETNWYLRDSNWDPDFPLSAQRAEWFLEKEINITVDGVIAINLQTIQNLLKAVGPVDLPDYQEQIDENNVFQRAEYHAEVNFFPGSTQKKDFLGSLSTTIFTKIKNLESEKWPSLVSELINSLEQKAILIYLNDPQVAALLRRYAWDGSILSRPKHFINSNYSLDLSDYFMVVDTNVGINKSNFFLDRKINWKGTILKDGRFQKNLELIYANESQSESWPGGQYKNYCRIILSDNNQLGGIRIGEGFDSLEAIDIKEIDIEKKDGKTIYGFYFKVPTGEKRVLSVSYVDDSLTEFKKDNYRLGFYWQKQSGTKADNFTFSLNYPMFIQATQVYPNGKLANQQVIFEGKLEKDKEFYVELSQ